MNLARPLCLLALAAASIATAKAADSLNLMGATTKPDQHWDVTLADFDTSQPMTAGTVVLPRATEPHGPQNHVEASRSRWHRMDDALTMKWGDAWYANLRFERKTPADLRPFLADGALELEVNAVDMAKAGLTFVVGCGTDCERKLNWVVPSRALQGKGWQHVAIPMHCFAHEGDDFSAVSRAFRLDSSGTGEVAIANVRFVRHAKGNVDCPDYRTQSVTPVPLEQVWSMDWWMPRHEDKLAQVRQQAADHQQAEVVFIGDSITHNWEKDGKPVWDRHYARYNAVDLGFGGDKTENVLWRLQHGEIDGMHPKVAVMMIGTNNTGDRLEDPRTIAAGIQRLLGEIRTRLPGTRVLLLAVFPRDASPDSPLRRNNDRLNTFISGFADNQHVFFLDINRALTEPDGTLSKDIMPDLLHPNERGYEIWAAQMEPTLLQLLAKP